MKKYFFLLLSILPGLMSYACATCEAQQPKILRNVIHGRGPDSKWDYFIVYVALLVVMATLFYSLKWLIKPGEKSDDHIKQLILNNQ